MTTIERTKNTSPLLGWTVVLGCMLSTTIEGGLWFSQGIFFKPLIETFGWSRAETSTANTSFMLAYAVSGFLLSRFADRYGPRRIMLIAALLTGAGLALSSRVTGLEQLILAYVLLGVGLGPTFVVPSATIQRWYIKRRGAMLGLVVSGVGLGAFIFAPMINFLISAYGWRAAFVIVGVISGLGLGIAALAMAHSPEHKGTKPYGWQEAEAAPQDFPVWSTREFATRQVLRTSAFWWLLLIIALGQMPIMFLSVHLVPYATDQGVSRAAAAGAIGILGLLSIPGRLVMGGIADRIGWKLSFALANYGSAAAVLAMMAIKSPLTLFVIVGSYGFFHGARVPPTAGLASFFFGTRSLGALIGLLIGISVFIGAFAPLLAGLLFDRLGSYQSIMLLSAGSFAAGGFILHFIRPPRQ
ncbi:MAG: MFS transporter [Dehalococcoidia bacterium]